MRMQEVIRQLRELAPAAAFSAKQAYVGAVSLRTILEDASRTQSVESMAAIVKLASDKLTDMWTLFGNCADSTRRLQELNESYKEKLGPRSRKPKDDPRQMDLFAGRSTVDDTSTTSCRACPCNKTSAFGCEFLDGGVCMGVVYPTNPPQYDSCVFCSGEARQ